jgi:hypothetical protein
MSHQFGSGPEFEYQGYLLFNGIFETEFISEEFEGGIDQARLRFSDMLPEYEEDDSGTTEGYERISLSEIFYDDETVDGDLQGVASSLITYRYLYEDRDTTEAYYNGDKVRVEVPRVNDADIFWRYPNYVYLRGAKDDVSETREKTFRTLQGDVRVSPVEFGGDFLLWLYYKTYESDPIPTSISVETLTDTELTGDRDAFGKTNTVDDSTDLEECVPMIAGILRDKSISLLNGYYELYDNLMIKAEIGSGRVHLRASEGEIQRSEDARRIAISLAFLDELVDLHSQWEELPPTDKYPPRSFFEDLYQTARGQGIEIDSISQDVLDYYGGRRDEDW